MYYAKGQPLPPNIAQLLAVTAGNLVAVAKIF